MSKYTKDEIWNALNNMGELPDLDEVNKGIYENYLEGNVEIVGVADNGDLTFRLTAQGETRAKELIEKYQ